MEKEKLHRFFAGTTSIQEGMDIRAWMEASEENKRIFTKSVNCSMPSWCMMTKLQITAFPPNEFPKLFVNG